MNITIIGNVCIDQNSTEGTSYTAAGSPAVFFNIILNKFPEVKSVIVTTYGPDFIEHSKGINIIPSKPNKDKTLIYKNIITNGKRTQYALNRENGDPVEITTEIKKLLSESDVLLFAPLLPVFNKEYLKEVLSHLPKSALKVLSPQGYFRNFDSNDKVIFREFAEAKEIISQFDFSVLSIEDYPNLLELSQDWVQGSESGVIITAGENPVLLIKDGYYESFPTDIVEDIIDSTGAGDVFTAAFIYKFVEIRDESESIHFAHKVAGKSLKYATNDLKSISLDELLA